MFHALFNLDAVSEMQTELSAGGSIWLCYALMQTVQNKCLYWNNKYVCLQLNINSNNSGMGFSASGNVSWSKNKEVSEYDVL